MKLKDKQNEEKEVQLKLLKIQLYAENCHTLFSSRFSFILVIFGFIVIFYPLYMQAVLTGNTLSIAGITGLVGTILVVLIAVIYSRKYIAKYNSTLRDISEMIEVVRKGEDLPTLEEMRLWKRK